MKKNNVFITVALIFILIFVRIVFYATEQILYIVYIINLVGLFYVIIQIMLVAYKEISAGIKPNSLNQIMVRKNKRVRNKFIRFSSILMGIAFIVGILSFAFSWKTALGVINDVIALLALGLSIEDERIYAWIVEREQR